MAEVDDDLQETFSASFKIYHVFRIILAAPTTGSEVGGVYICDLCSRAIGERVGVQAAGKLLGSGVDAAI